jgi:RHS repeat-associated protein
LGVYDADGTPLSESAIGNRVLWQGREYSWETGLYYFRARWYDPITGRWLSKDPIGIAGGLNQYVFCGNNPVNFRDPWGLLDLDDVKIVERTTTFENPENKKVRKFGVSLCPTDDGLEKVELLTNLSGDTGYDENCHGWTFLGDDAEYWIDGLQVPAILKGDRYSDRSTPMVGDVVTYTNPQGEIVHSGRVVRIDPKTGAVTIKHKPGEDRTASTEDVTKAWKTTATISYWRK